MKFAIANYQYSCSNKSGFVVCGTLYFPVIFMSDGKIIKSNISQRACFSYHYLILLHYLKYKYFQYAHTAFFVDIFVRPAFRFEKFPVYFCRLLLKRRDIITISLPCLQPWTLISTHVPNVAKKCFSANVPKVLIFVLLVRTGTINEFSYRTAY